MYKIFILGTLLGMVFCDHHDETNLPSACRIPPDTNDCGGSEQKWFYHPNLMACSKFLYKGCQSSPNHFNTREECEKLCLPPFEEKKKEETKIEDINKDTKGEMTKTVDEPKQKATAKIDSATTIIPEKQPKPAEKTVKSVKEANLEASKQTEVKPTDVTEKDSHNKDGEINDGNDNEDDDDEQMENLVNEQEEMRKRFNMADSDDFLTLEQYMQDDNMDLSDILPAEGTVQQEGDILGNYYAGDVDEEEVVQEVNAVKDKKNEDSNPKKDDVKPQQQKPDMKKEEPLNVEKDKKPTEPEKESADYEDVENQKDDNSLEEMVEEERYLEERFGMADSDDMLALQEVMQSPDMEVQEAEEEGQQAVQIPETTEESMDSKSDIPSNNEDVDEDLEEATKRREQFSMADNADYMALEEIMGNPEVQEMEIIQDNGSFNDKNRDEIRIAHMEISNSPSNDGILYSQNRNSNVGETQRKSDGYGEHLDHSHTESHQGEESAEEETIRFEEELEKQFNMADREDILSLEEMIQDPNMDMGEIIPSDKAGEKQAGDIAGVLSMAASFLGEDSKEQNRNFEEINEDIQQLPAIAKNPINEATMEIRKDFGFGKKIEEKDFRHPADKLEQQINEDKPENIQPIDIERMRHNDKMMLISLLHLDGLKVNKIAGTTTPVLKPFKGSDFLKMGPLNRSPNKDFFDIMNIKGIRKCCLLPRDPGPCKNNKILQWHFDPMIGTCLPFFYGGCKGNRNRFDTIGECLRKCGSRRVQMESLPEPIPEPPTSKSSLVGLKSMISGLMPGKILSLHEKMSPGQQKFIHKFIKSALKHVTDIKPVKIGPFFPSVFSENRVDSIKNMKPPVPLKSVMFKWPMLKMVFDKRKRDMSMPGRPETREDEPSRISIENFMGPGPRDFRIRGRDRDEMSISEFRKRGREFEERGRDQDENPFKEFRKRGREFEERGRDRDENPLKEFRKRGRDNEDKYYRKKSKHFSPSFKKSYKMMSHHEDNRHQISSDPKNKVNLIQVFVNKPNTESNSNPSHHHTMIKKQFSPEPQIKAPLPPAPPVNRNTPSQAYPPQQFMYPQTKPISQSFPPLKHPQGQHFPAPLPPQNQVRPPMQHRIIPPHQHNVLPPMQHQIIPQHQNQGPPPMQHQIIPQHQNQVPPPMQHQIIPSPNNNMHAHNHPHYHHEHPPMVGPHHHHGHPPMAGPHTHFHVHHPHQPQMMHNYPHPVPPFFEHPKPWWARFDRPYFEPPFHGHRSHIRPSTGYPHKNKVANYNPQRLEELDNRRSPPEEEDVVVVTMPQGDSDGELHYACLLPVSTGMCKAFLEKYYFNRATGKCEMFIYGGCGGNANNYGSKEECQATCLSTSPVPKFEDATTLPDDTIIITSPVYVPNSEEEKVNKEDAKQAAEVPVKVQKEPTAVKVGKQDNKESDAVKVEPVSLFKSTNTEYIIVIAVMCFVGLAVVVLVALAVANLSKRNRVSKKERVLEAVLSSHLEGRSTGTITPRSLYYGHPPSETGPPPISDVPKIHKETFDEQL